MVRFAEVPEDDPALGTLMGLLHSDMAKYEKMLGGDDVQFARRAYFRAAFAYLEGHVHRLKQQLAKGLVEQVKHGDTIPLHKIALLQDESARVGQTGKVEIGPARVSTAPSIAFMLRSCAELFGHDSEQFFREKGWSELQKSLKVRDRITHPKRVEDLTIKDEEIDSLREGLTWIIRSMTAPVRRMLGEDEQKDTAS